MKGLGSYIQNQHIEIKCIFKYHDFIIKLNRKKPFIITSKLNCIKTNPIEDI